MQCLEQRSWRSYRAVCRQVAAPHWLQFDYVLSFGTRCVRAVSKYMAFIHEGARFPSVWGRLQGQVDRGPKAHASNIQALVRMLSEYAATHSRNEAIASAYLSGQHTMAVIARHFLRSITRS